jgi:uncharacterized protein (TIGR03437 family)
MLPKQLAGASVEVNSEQSDLFLVSPNQINIALADDLEGSTARVVVDNKDSTSEAQWIEIADTSLSLFSVDQSGTGAAVVQHADFSVVDAQSPALPNEVVILYATGLGNSKKPPAILIGGRPAEVQFAGAQGFFAGLDQINVRIPNGLAANADTAIVLITDDGVTDLTTIPIGSP